jgi:hypothetical protein
MNHVSKRERDAAKIRKEEAVQRLEMSRRDGCKSKEEGPVRLRHIRHKMEYSRNVSQKVMVITLESDRNFWSYEPRHKVELQDSASFML